MIRAVNANMEKTRRDLLILGKISTVMLKSKDRAQTERKRQRCNYTHESMVWNVLTVLID